MIRLRLLFFLFALALAPTCLNAQPAPDNATTNAAPASPAETASSANGPDLAPLAPLLTAPGAAQLPPQKHEDILDIRPPILGSNLWLWIALGIAALIALLVLGWFGFRSIPRTINPRTAYDLTMEKLEKARALLREDAPMPYAVAVSEAIRHYLGLRFNTRATRRTTEEFLRQMEADRETTPLAEFRELLRHFLQSCDLVKFARYQPTLGELEEVHQRAISFVTATKPAPVADEAGGRKP
jgi:hypothetical protein